MSAPGSRACPIRATSGAKETDHLRIAAASRASANCWKPSLTQTTQIMPTRRNGPTTTIPTRSTNCQSNMPSSASQTAATPLAHASPRKSPSVRPPDLRGLHRIVTVKRPSKRILPLKCLASSCDNRCVFLVTSNHNNSKNHYNNCSGDKQSNSQRLIPLTAIPHKEACHQQRSGETTDNNAN